jgi:TRAP-type C4-dicarboxylate transport system permease small subunit
MEIYNKIVKKSAGVIIWAMIFVALIQVFFRFVVNAPLIWPEELARFLQIWLVAIGVSAVNATNSHLRMDFLVQHLPRKLSFILEYISDVFLLVFWCILLFVSIKLNLMKQQQLSSALGISYGWIYWSIPVMSLLTVIDYFTKLIRSTHKYTMKNESENSA